MAVNVKFFIDTLNVGAHGAQADAKVGGNLFVGVTFREGLQDFEFPRGKSIGLSPRGRLGRRLRLEGLHDLARDVAGHGRAATMDFADSLKDFGRAAALVFNALSAGAFGNLVKSTRPAK